MTRSRRFFASSPWIATGTPDYVNLGYTSRGLAKQALMRLPRKSLTLFRKLGLDERVLGYLFKRSVFVRLDDYFRWRLKLSYDIGPFARLELVLLRAYVCVGGRPA